jgi:3',5'-cyclic AMP phosphodiesterase CpdA
VSGSAGLRYDRRAPMRLSSLLSLAVLLVACGGASPSPPPAPTSGAATAASPLSNGVRFIIGGDSRNDSSHVLPWAFREAKARGASAFLFLGDMELSPELDRSFERELAWLDPVPFYPALGNHEIKQIGFMPMGQAAAERAFAHHFLGTARTPVRSALPGRVVYSVDLPGGFHFVALDNVSQNGFGADQVAWLADDLAKAHADSAVHHIAVGMHKPLAHNGVSQHGMDRDGDAAAAESDQALALFQKNGVALIVASHVHRFAKFVQGGIPSYITGGLGAPLDRGDPDSAFHHFLQLDVTDADIAVTVVKFEGTKTMADEPD